MLKTFNKRRPAAHVVALCAAAAAIAAPARAAAADADWIKAVGQAVTVDSTGDAINAIALSSDGKQLIVDTEPTLFFLDAASGKTARAAQQAHRPTSGLAAPSASLARFFVTTWADLPNTDKSGRTPSRQAGELLAVDVSGKKSQHLFDLKKEPHVLAASADGKRVALGFDDGMVQVIDGASGKSLLGPVKLVPGMAVAGQRIDGVSALAFSPDGARIAIAGADVSVRIVDAASGKVLTEFVYGGLSGGGTHTRVDHLAFTADGTKLVSAAQDRNLSLHDAATSRLLGAPVRVAAGVSALAIGADGKTVFTGDNDGRLQRWELKAL
ncbi:MAG: WD40 repeat domain-containing protein [Caldimonas sp.]